MSNPTISFLAVVQIVVFSAAASADSNVVTEPFVGVRVIHSKSMKPRQIDIWVAEIDLKAPGVSVLVTPSNGELPGDTTPLTVREFAAKTGAQLGINGSFFSMAAKGKDGKSQYNVNGLSASKGDAYSPFAHGYLDAINISKYNVATIIRGTGDDSRIASAKTVSKKKNGKVASPNPGSTTLTTGLPEGERPKTDNHKSPTNRPKPSEINVGFDHEPNVPLYNALSGRSVLVADGKNAASDDPSIHPRTAIGIKADGKLLLFTVDGREAGRSLGLKLSEAADVLVHFGAREAINLDGGGSTTFVMDDPATTKNDPKVMNLPCDPFSKSNEGKKHGKERPVGNALVVFARVKGATPRK
jgi:hypothetical protein